MRNKTNLDLNKLDTTFSHYATKPAVDLSMFCNKLVVKELIQSRSLNTSQVYLLHCLSLLSNKFDDTKSIYIVGMC